MTKPLSERLSALADDWESWNDDHPDDQSPITEELLREAAALARRVEGAPVGAVSGFLPTQRAAEVILDSGAAARGQRVRLVPEVG